MIHPRELAEEACHIELDLLHEPIGKQDQYISAFGGLTCFEFCPDGKVNAWPLNISEETLFNLEDNLLLFFTGFSRPASRTLREQDDQSRANDQGMIQNLHFIKELGHESAADHQHGGHSRRNRPGLLRQLHYRAAEGAPYP